MFSVTQMLSILPVPSLSAMVLWGQALGSGEVDLPGGLVSPPISALHTQSVGNGVYACWDLYPFLGISPQCWDPSCWLWGMCFPSHRQGV